MAPHWPGEVWLLYTSFPVATETFLQRELRAFRRLGVPVKPMALWRHAAAWEGLTIEKVAGLRPLVVGRALAKQGERPRLFARLWQEMANRPVPNLLNLGENLLGLSAGVELARRIRSGTRPLWLHAAWGSLPAMAALVAHELTGIGFSFGAHAYDLFEDDGDWLLPTKIAAAKFIQTSTEQGRDRLLALGAAPGKVVVVRRGLSEIPPPRTRRADKGPLRVLAVGRLVAKMGHAELLKALPVLRARGLDFTARIVGDGPLGGELRREARALGLAGRVEFTGALSEAAVQGQLAWADALVFSGIVSRTGDRAGFPNAVGEAMAAGVPVVAYPTGGVTEGVRDGVTGLIARNPAELADRLMQLAEDPHLAGGLVAAARTWVSEHFDAVKNTQVLVERWRREAGLVVRS